MPASTAWRIASLARSRPGAFPCRPRQRLGAGHLRVVTVEIPTAVAACSSLIAGIWRSGRSALIDVARSTSSRSRKRPGVSAHKCCGIEPVVLVGHELLKGKPTRALERRKERGRLLLRVTVTQCVIVNRHVSMPHLPNECDSTLVSAEVLNQRARDMTMSTVRLMRDARTADHRTVKCCARWPARSGGPIGTEIRTTAEIASDTSTLPSDDHSLRG